MSMIFEISNFSVVAHDNPHHDRNNGGHLKVFPKKRYSDRTEMPIDLYVAMMKLVVIAGEAVTNVMRKKGIDVVRINYQDNGNWAYFSDSEIKPHIHVHLYVRSNNEKHPTGDERFKAFPNALFFPFIEESPEYYESFKPYSEQDCTYIRAEIERLLDVEKYEGVRKEL